MAPKSKVLKIITVLAFIWLLIILLMNIFNNGHSYYYSKVERKLNDQSKMKLMNHNQELDDFWQNKGDDHDINLLQGYNIKEPSTDELIAQFEKNLPNVPFAYFERHKNLDMEKFKNCAQYPPIQILNYYNNYWQTYTIRNITFQLYGAYYDERQGVNNGPVVRILAMINQITAPFPTSYCQLWFENDTKPQVVAITKYELVWNLRWGKVVGMYYPYLMTCDIPKEANITGDRIPKAINIVEHQCDMAKNSLKVIYDKPKRKEEKLSFAVCVKGLDFPYKDISIHLVEWLEMQRILGATKIYFHHIATHPNVTKVLNYYQQQGFIEWKPISLMGGVVALPQLEHWLLGATQLNKRLNELIPYNDCFYRNMYRYDYIAIVDIDEIIMPLGTSTTWHDLVKESKKFEELKKCPQGFAGICVPNVYFPYTTDNFTLTPTLTDSVPSSHSYMFMLNHQYRFQNHTKLGYNTKCLHNSSQALTLHNHYPLKWLNSCKPLDLPSTMGHLQHYHDVKADVKNHELILDDNIERFRKTLTYLCTAVFKDLDLIR